MKQITLKEIFYYAFFSLLFIAKGIGLYDGQKIFKVILLCACFFWVGKMMLTSYSIKEILVIGVLLVLGAFSYYFSGDKAALISVMTVVGMKDIPVKRLFKIGLIIWSIAFWGTITAALLGIKSSAMFVHNKEGLGFVIRSSLGMTHPNVLHISYMVFAALCFLVYDFKGKALLKAVGIFFAGSLFIFMYSLSYTGFLFFIAYLVLVVYLTQMWRRTKAENVILQCLMPICAAFSILGPVLLRGRLFDLVNKAVNTRFELSRHYLTTLIPGLLGTQVNIEGNYTIDCSYVHCLYYYGIFLFLLFMLGLFMTIRYLMNNGRNQELAMTLGLVAAGFTEPFLFNFSFKNIILPIMGEMLFVYLAAPGRLRGFEKNIQICRKQLSYTWRGIPALKVFIGKLGAVMSAHKKALWAGIAAGILAGFIIGNQCICVEPYVIVNKNTSDRVGKKGDYKIYQELPEEIKENSLKINVYEEDTKVFVLSGSITEYEEIRKKITVCVYGGACGMAAAMAVLLWRQSRKKDNENFNAGKLES